MKRLLQIIIRATGLFAWLLVSPIIILMPRNRHKIIFGAWGGRQFSCNPKYLFKYMSSQKDFTCIWIGNESLRQQVLDIPGGVFVRKGSIAALWHCLTAGVYVCNVNWREDIADLPRCGRVELVYTTHGYADKNVGVKQFAGKGEVLVGKQSLQSLRDLLNKLEEWLFGYKSWCSESSEQGIAIRLSNQPFIMSPDKMLRFGKPRADYFINNKSNNEERIRQKEKIAKVLGLPVDKKWYLYVPTWRHEDSKIFSFSTSNRKAELENVLKAQGAILIEKQHPIVLRRCSLPFGLMNEVAVLTHEQSQLIDTQELLMASDLLITDYSSIYYDFVLLDRPVIHFAYDYDDFMSKEMGFNFDIRDYGGGPFAYSEEELLSLLKKADNDLLAQRNPSTRRDHLTFEKGNACERYCELFGEIANASR